MVKNLPTNAGDRCDAWEDPLVEGTAAHSSVLAWRVPWTEEPGGATAHGVTATRTRLNTWLTYNSVLVSGVQQTDSLTETYMFLRPLFIIGSDIIWNRIL